MNIAMCMICPVHAAVSINSSNTEITYPPSPLRLPSALTAGAGVYSCEFIVSHARPFPFRSADRFQHKLHPARPLCSAAPIEIGVTESLACKTIATALFDSVDIHISRIERELATNI